MISTKKAIELISRGTEEILVGEELKKKLASGKRLKIKAGFDATGRRVTQQTMKRWLSRMIAKHGAVEAKNMFIRRFGRENAKLLGEKAFQVATKTVVKETTKQLVIEGLEQTTKQTTKGVVREGGKQLGLRAFGKAF